MSLELSDLTNKKILLSPQAKPAIYENWKTPACQVTMDTSCDEQAVMELTLQRARLGGAPKSQRRKYRELDQRLTRIREGFRQGDCTVEEFLDSLMHIVHRF